jgi:hypothetical protein
MPGPEQLIRAAVVLPWTITRRVVGFGLGLLPGVGGADEARWETVAQPTPRRAPEPVAPERVTPEPRAAAVEAVERERAPEEEAIFTPDDDFFDDDEHVDTEVELVAESADAEAPEPPGPQIHVDEPWEGYRRMKVAEIVTRLEGQPAEVLAAVELYETTHRHRGGVLNAVRDLSRG